MPPPQAPGSLLAREDVEAYPLDMTLKTIYDVMEKKAFADEARVSLRARRSKRSGPGCVECSALVCAICRQEAM